VIEDCLDRFPRRCRGDAQAQRRERIERMRGRKAQCHAGALGLPQHAAISELALARNFGRADVAELLQDRTKRDRHRRDVDARSPLPDAFELQIRKRRDEVEVPGCLHGSRLGKSKRLNHEEHEEHGGKARRRKTKAVSMIFPGASGAGKPGA
jgi:hypothetical protein